MASAVASCNVVLAHSAPLVKGGIFLPPTTVQNRSLTFAPLKPLKVSKRTSQVSMKASPSPTDESSVDPNEFLTDLKEKWDGVENKSTVILYGGGAIVAVWLASALVGAVNSIPLLPKILELVGLGYTGWFVYRYLLFKSSRKELASDIESLKKKVTGADEF